MALKKLTAQEVASKHFTTVRMREGYSIDEVDEFLERVEDTLKADYDELEQLAEQNTRFKLQPKADDLQRDYNELKSTHEAKVRELAKALENLAILQKTVEKAGGETATAKAEAVAARKAQSVAEDRASQAEEILATEREAADKPMDLAGASVAVTRMLENAGKNYDELIAQGEAEAEAIKSKAMLEATEIRSAAEQEATQVMADVNKVKNEAFGNIEEQKRELEDSISHLRSVQQRSRDELIRIYTAGLEAVKAEDVSKPVESPRTHRSLDFKSVPAFNED